MYSGTLIDDLMAAVERAENNFRAETQNDSKSETWFAVLPTEVFALDAAAQFAGVA
jgi:hypothetical protein